ncbi:zinc-binding metallopeptidase family protein [Caldanaerobius polysaccharolyticus]|uniref:hypothetical protein n=1 Tax=Caldanaerobius polysaccharolyticus TaxID=44256 RepID=UPI000690CFA8|nr:hypothetical protein [Caldanaerobius polysaccharolyticus]
MIRFTTLVKATAEQLLDSLLPSELRMQDYKRITHDSSFLYAPGDIPVMLVAHLDTVHKKPPRKIYYDPAARVYWSPDGLGADDRAGVYAILQLLNRKLRPYVLFTDEEETGGGGAWEAVEVLDPPTVNLIIELDRKGSTDAVFYDCDNPEMEKYITGFGFRKAFGSFSDISILCPEWGIGGVNLSVGFYEAHTRVEYLCMNELEDTIERVVQILANPPAEKFEYIPAYYDYDWYDDECPLCLQPCNDLYIIPGFDRWPVCADCFEEFTGRKPSVQDRAFQKLLDFKEVGEGDDV